MKKGVFFSLDALIAIILMISVVVVTSVYYINKSSPEQPVFFSSDLVQILSSAHVGDFNDPRVVAIINNSNITETNRTVLEQALRFQVAGYPELATALINATIGGLIPDYYKVGVWIEDFPDPIFTTGTYAPEQLISSKQMISGIEKNRTIEGLASRAFLAGINERTTSAYAYFGGYEGDGDITKVLFLPPEINYVDYAYLELDAGSDFDLIINGVFSGHYNSTYDMMADEIEIPSGYLSNFKKGDNNVTLSFNGSNRYVGGGYFRVDYSTSELSRYEDNGNDRYYFPGIDGVINIYSSFFVPGDLQDMNIRIHYDSDYELFMNIGGETIYSYKSVGENIVNISDAELRLQLNYTQMSNKTIPVRLGLRNVSYSFGGMSDAILITDRTGSMDACDVEVNCSTPGICDSSTGDGDPCQQRRDIVAQESDETFINEMLGVAGNYVGLVGYGKESNPVCSFHDLSSDNSSLEDRISDYYGEWCGYTCISCGVDAAMNLLVENQRLYDTEHIKIINHSEHNLGDSYPVSVSEILNFEFNESVFVKSRLTVYARGIDTESGYKDCIFFNGNYLGRMCESNDDGSVGWHTCNFLIKKGWFYPGEEFNESWTWTTQADFESCSLDNINVTYSLGDATIINSTGGMSEIFYDNFDDNDISEYTQYGSSWSTTSYSGYGYVLRYTNNGNTVIYEPSIDVSGSYIIKATIWNEDDDHGGVAFRINAADPDNFYSCSATSNNRFDAGIWRHDNDINTVPSSSLATSNWDYVRSRWYNITIIVNETSNTIRCIWESAEAGVELDVTATDDDNWESGSVGFWISQQDNFMGDLLSVYTENLNYGTITSPVYGYGIPLSFDYITWTETLSLGTDVLVEVRTGNTPTPDSSWDNYDWSDTTYTSPGTISQASGTYIQWRATLSSDDPSLATPVLSDVSIDFSGDYRDNLVTITAGDSSGCFSTSSDQDEWLFKEVELSVWESEGPTNEYSYFNSTEKEIGDSCPGCSITSTLTFDSGVTPMNILAGYITLEAIDVSPNYYDCVFVNDHYIGRLDYQRWSGDNEWQNVTLDIPAFVVNDSIIKVKMTSGNTYGCEVSGSNDEWRFRNVDFNLIYEDSPSDYNRYMSMLVMSDGQANTKIGHRRSYDSANAGPEAVQRACEAFEKYGIRIYSVAFGAGAEESTMQDIACCDDCDNYYNANNAEDLMDIYTEIAREMIKLQFSAQVTNVTHNISTKLFTDSYIEFNYTPPIPSYEYGRVPITIESSRMNNNITEGTFYAPNEVTIYEAKITSYSSDKWTDKAMIYDGVGWNTFFNLSSYGSDYYLVGDPYVIDVPVSLIRDGENIVRIMTALSPLNTTGGSPDNRIIYVGGINLEINYTGVFEKAEGCRWSISFEDGTSNVIPIPSTYPGTKVCSFDNTTDCTNEFFEDAIDNTICHLFKQMDFDGDGLLFVKFGATDLDVETISIGKIPFMWGPTMVDVRVWK